MRISRIQRGMDVDTGAGLGNGLAVQPDRARDGEGAGLRKHNVLVAADVERLAQARIARPVPP